MKVIDKHIMRGTQSRLTGTFTKSSRGFVPGRGTSMGSETSRKMLHTKFPTGAHSSGFFHNSVSPKRTMLN
jgi:hypothetical protein